MVHYGFATTNSLTGQLVIPENTKKRILNVDKLCLLLNESNGNSGGCPTVTYYNFFFPQFGKMMSKSALMTTMISRSNVAGEPIPPTSNSRQQLRPLRPKLSKSR